MSSAAFVLVSQILTVIGCGLTLLVLYRARLHTRYRNFFAFFLFRLVDTLAAVSVIQMFGNRSDAYFYLWITATPLGWVFYVLVVLELYALILEKHPGVYTLGRWGMYLGIGVAVILSGMALLPKIKPAMPQRSFWLFVILGVDRGVTFALVLFVLIMLVMLACYPVPLSRNVKVHAVLYTVLFLSSTLNALLHSAFGLKYASSIDAIFMGVSSVCGWMWFFFLRPAGEEVRTRLPELDPEQESRLLHQIESLNTTLLKVSRN
jgi:hypothetical protein